MRINSEILNVVQIYKIKEEGVTCPIECLLQNGRHAVVKYPRNNFGNQVLVNEWIGNNIASIVGLPIPDYGLCNISAEVIDNADLYELDRNNAGIGFFSVLLPNTVPASFGLLNEISNKEAEKMFLFDYLVNNKDRHRGNILIDLSGNDISMICIDNSHILFGTHIDFNVLDQSINELCDYDAFVDMYNSDYYRMFRNSCGIRIEKMKELLGDFEKNVSYSAMNEIIETVPQQWISDKRINDALINAIMHRLSNMEKFVNEIGRRCDNG